MKKLQFLSLGLALAMLATTACSKTTLENQSSVDKIPQVADQTPSSGTDTTSSDLSGKPLEAADAAAAANEIDIKEAVYFEFDSAELNAQNQNSLSQKAKWLQSHPQVAAILIEGHCDERGTDAYNMALGARRADAIKNYLIDLGVPNNKLETQSFGEEKPADPNHNEAAWAKNRRADFVVD